MAISANQALNIEKVCLGFATYDGQLPDVYLTNFLYNFKIEHIIACSRFIRPLLQAIIY